MAYGSRYIDPTSGMVDIIYPPTRRTKNLYPSGYNSNSNALSVIPQLASNSQFASASSNPNIINGTIIDAEISPVQKRNLKNWFGDNFGWSKSSGAKAFGKNIGKYANIGNAAMQGFNAFQNMQNLTDTRQDTDAIISDILRSAASNPLTSSYLTSDQQSMLNQLKRGTYDEDAGFFDTDLMSLLGGAGQGALSGGLLGGIPGAIIGGVGGLVNTGLESQNQAQGLTNSELEGLLQALTDAEAQYKMMKRPNFTGLGIQQQYLDMYR